MSEEIWKDVLGYEGHYMVSNMGNVKSNKIIKKTLKPGRASNRYLTVALCLNGKPKSRLVHILVLEAFVCKRPPGMHGLHGDNNRINNRLDNLRWGTVSDNANDQIKAGVFNFCAGEKHLNAKLKNSQVLEIKKMLSSGAKNVDVAKRFSVSERNISRIKTGQRWGHIQI